MKKNYLVVVMIALLSPFFGTSQSINQKNDDSQSHRNLSVRDSYGLTYELVDPSLITSDSLIFNKIDANMLDSFREEHEDVTIVHKYHGFSILIYSREKCRANKVKITRPLNN